MVRDPEGPGRTRSVSRGGAGGDRYHPAAEKTGASQGIKENGQVSAQTATAADSQASKATIDLGNHAGGKPGRNRRKISAACDIAIAHSLSRSAAARSFFTLRSAIEALSPKPGQLTSTSIPKIRPPAPLVGGRSRRLCRPATGIHVFGSRPRRARLTEGRLQGCSSNLWRVVALTRQTRRNLTWSACYASWRAPTSCALSSRKHAFCPHLMTRLADSSHQSPHHWPRVC